MIGPPMTTNAQKVALSKSLFINLPASDLFQKQEIRDV
jgi:hypothetical protein